MHFRNALFAPIALVGLVGLALSASSAGCRHEKQDAPPIAVLPETGPISDAVVLAPQPTVLVNGVDEPADLSCLPSRGGMLRADVGVIRDDAAPTPDTGTDDAAIADAGTPINDADVPAGTLVDHEIELIAFGTGGADKLKNETVDVFYYNTFNQAPDISGLVSDENGLVRLKLPKGLRVGYHVRSSTTLSDFYGLDDLHIPLGGAPKARWQGITRERQNTLAQAVTGQASYPLPPGTGIISGRVMDCQRRTIQSASVILRDMDTNQDLTFVKCGTGLCVLYLSDAELPNLGLHWTSRSSLFAMIDVPVNRRIRAIALGSTPDGKKEEIGHRDIEVKDGGIVFQIIEPDNH